MSGRHGLLAIVLACPLAGCGTAQMTRGGSLSSYDNMTASNGVLTKSLIYVAKDNLAAAKTLRIASAVFAEASSPTLSEKQRLLVANTVNRSLCSRLSERFAIVGPNEPADLTVHIVVTQAEATNEVAAGASKVASIVPTVLGSPVPVPRLPIGLGSLTVEAEAVDHAGRQQAAMLWARGADSFTTSATVSKAGDAYELASTFGDDFSRLLVTGDTPFGKLPELPSLQNLGSQLGGKQKYVACEAFGRAPGIPGMIGRRVGMPPEWSDDGAKPADAL
jgi:hypothetical protein